MGEKWREAARNALSDLDAAVEDANAANDEQVTAPDGPEEYAALLQDDEGDCILDCGCYMTRSYSDQGVYFVQCPMHQKAEEMHRLLAELAEGVDMEWHGDPHDTVAMVCQYCGAVLDTSVTQDEDHCVNKECVIVRARLLLAEVGDAS